MPLPECFCWSRFGTEAGQSIEEILARKEQERISNNGLFFWGIGNAIGPSMLELLRRTESPEAIFSPIQSLPRQEDVMPKSVVAWTEAETLSGDEYQLPRRSLITSRIDPLKQRAKHYALVCYRGHPIEIRTRCGRLPFSELRNLLTNRPVGASQVTAVVHLRPGIPAAKSRLYDVAFKARLAPPYLIQLKTPLPLNHVDQMRPWSEIVGEAWDVKQSELPFSS